MHKHALASILAGLVFHFSVAFPDSGVGLSPIANFEESWVASSAQRTIVALPVQLNVEEQGVILLLRSRESECIEFHSVEAARDVAGLRLLEQVPRSVQDSAASSISHLTRLGPTTICSMTGLASDVEYLSRVLQQTIENHRTIHDEASVTQSKFLSPFQLVQTSCRLIQEATISKGSRPLGLQALFIGYHPDQPEHLDIFTVDPSGSFHHWPRGTAIGRNAVSLRSELAKAFDVENSSNAKNVLEGALRRCIDGDNPTSASQFMATLVTRQSSALSFSIVDPNQINEIINDTGDD